MNRRRRMLAVALSGPLALIGWRPAHAKDPAALARIRDGWRRLLPAGTPEIDASEKVARSEAQWRARLGDAAYGILFEEHTERPFSSPLNDEKRPGIFTCAACDLPLFSSEMKFDSGTGWPSFFTHIPGHLDTQKDYRLIWPRTEYHCVRCGGHQGHVFADGPPPTSERWCNNGLALRFLPADG